VEDQKIKNIAKIDSKPGLPYLLPGFIDAHVHVESSMLVPSEFARLAVVHGTVATISDPHEIANVCGMQGVEYMIENGKQVPFHFFFGAPSCVPATPFETAGGEINVADIETLMSRPEILYLAEMMNWPGTVNRDPVVLEKIRISQHYGKPIDGHAPGLMGELAEKYVAAGPSTDHECFTYEEALGKIKLGMKISIREGSAAKNFEALIDLIDEYPEMLLFCSDDKHPDNLALSHINELVIRAIAKGKNLFDVLRAACINPILHYSLPVGQLRDGDGADFIVVKDLEKFEVLATYIQGKKVDENGILTVTAEELTTHEMSSIIVNANKSGLSQEEIANLIEEAIELEVRDEIERIRKQKHYQIDDFCGNITINIKNKQFKLSVNDKEIIEKYIENITLWLNEKKYYDRISSGYSNQANNSYWRLSIRIE
jgi:adenine deaminase